MLLSKALSGDAFRGSCVVQLHIPEYNSNAKELHYFLYV